TVREVIPDHGAGRFNLNPSAETPFNAFVPLRFLQETLGQKGRVDALLAAGGARDLQEKLREKLALDDWGLVLNEPKDPDGSPRGYLSLESRQMYVEPGVATAAKAAADEVKLRTAPTLVYLANTIADGKNQIPYSVVAALDPTLPYPLGPFLPPGVDQLKDDEIVRPGWDEPPLKPKPGDPITLTYFKPEEEGRLPEVTAAFKFKGFVPLQGVADDRDLTPEFPGITDKLTIRDWNPPFP